MSKKIKNYYEENHPTSELAFQNSMKFGVMAQGVYAIPYTWSYVGLLGGVTPPWYQ